MTEVMNEKEYREKYNNLKMQEMFEPDEDKRKEISKIIKTMETDRKRNTIKEIDAMLDELPSENIENVEKVEITGGKTKWKTLKKMKD